jgi:O-antigen/teichoic acid export membrane protein
MTTPPATDAAAAAARSVSAIAFNQVAQVTGSLLFIAFVPRALGVQVYGQLAFAFAFITLLQMLGELGYQEIFSRFLPEVRRGHGEAGVLALVRVLFAVRAVLGLALGLAALASSRLAAPWLSPAEAGLIGAAVALRVWAMGPFPLLLGLGQTLKWSVETTWRQIIVTGLILLLVRGPAASLTPALAALALHEAVFLLLGLWWTRSFLKWGDWRRAFDRSARSPLRLPLSTYLKFGFTFSLANFSLVFLFRISPITVEALTGSHPETGYFDLAQGGLLFIYTLLGQVAYAFVPILTQLHLEQRAGEAAAWLGRVVRYPAMLAALALGGMWAVAEPLAPLLFGSGFGAAAGALRMMAFGLLPLPVAWAGVMLAAVDKRPRRKLWAALLGVALYFAAALALRAGAAPGFALAFALAMLGYAVGFGRGALEAVRTGGAGWLAAALGSAVFAPLFFSRFASLPLALAAWAGLAVLYLALMLLTRAARLDEIRLVLASLRFRRP